VQVFGHGFLTKDGLKMGKSLGNTLDPAALVQAYGPDAVRLFFMKEVRAGTRDRAGYLCWKARVQCRRV
jgi:methionyl-tRNA synthetase